MYANQARIDRQSRADHARRDAIRALTLADLVDDDTARTWVTEIARMLAAGRRIDWVATVAFVQRMNANATSAAEVAGATRALRIATELA